MMAGVIGGAGGSMLSGGAEVSCGQPGRGVITREAAQERGRRTMAWSKRGSTSVYYRSARAEGRVRRHYFGSGVEARLAAALDDHRQKEREARRLALQAEAQRRAAADAPLRAFARLTDLLAGAALALAGFHRHDRGPWRKARQLEARNDDARR
jgi:hypothetical protein